MRTDRLANALGAMGCPNPRSVAVLTLEVLDQLGDDVTGGLVPQVEPHSENEGAEAFIPLPRLAAVRGASVLDEAEELVNGDRQEDYGDPVVCMGNWAEILRILYGWDIDAHKASVAMSLLKHVREAHRPKRDNRVDSPAYMHIADIAYERLFGGD